MANARFRSVERSLSFDATQTAIEDCAPVLSVWDRNFVSLVALKELLNLCAPCRAQRHQGSFHDITSGAQITWAVARDIAWQPVRCRTSQFNVRFRGL